MEDKKAKTDNSAQEAVQKPIKVFRLQIDQTETYHLCVEAESAEQARAAWEENNDEASDCMELSDRKEQGEEELSSVSETDEDPDFYYEDTLKALGIELPEED